MIIDRPGVAGAVLQTASKNQFFLSLFFDFQKSSVSPFGTLNRLQCTSLLREGLSSDESDRPREEDMEGACAGQSPSSLIIISLSHHVFSSFLCLIPPSDPFPCTESTFPTPPQALLLCCPTRPTSLRTRLSLSSRRDPSWLRRKSGGTCEFLEHFK